MVIIINQCNINRHYHDYVKKYALNLHFIVTFSECKMYFPPLKLCLFIAVENRPWRKAYRTHPHAR